MNGWSFAEPQWIHLLWVVLGLGGLLLWLELRGVSMVQRFISITLQARLVKSVSLMRRLVRLTLLLLASVFLVIALMRPQWGLQFVSTPRMSAEIMICLDVSRSMLAEDVAPNRLERAKADLRDLLAYMKGDQVGLIAFAGRASVLSPLTPDFGFLQLVLDEAGPASVQRGGTQLEEPIRKALAGFGDTAEVSRSILLITDGEDHDSFPLEAAKEAMQRGVRILAIGFGDEAGSEIQVSDSETGARQILRNADGDIVKTRLDGDLLREMALHTDGAYIPAGTGVLDLESIYQRHIATLTRGLGEDHGRTVRNDAFQWAILLALFCLLVAVVSGSGSIRRGHSFSALLILALLSIMGNTPKTYAEPNPTVEAIAEPTPSQSPRASYNQGLEALQRNDPEQAERLFNTAREAAGTDAELRFRISYNLAWVEVKRAETVLESAPDKALVAFQHAADRFREAIALRAGHADSRHNLEVILRRTMALADHLAKKEKRDLTVELETLIASQRTFQENLRGRLDWHKIEQDGYVVGPIRSLFRSLAANELEVLAEAEAFTEWVTQEVQQLQQKPKEEQNAEDRLREAQLQSALHYLHRARERMGQARNQLRRIQAERAYRRGAAALVQLKRARDQLLDPVARIDQLLQEGSKILQLTNAKAALAMNVLPEEQAGQYKWLTLDYLQDAHQDQQARVKELHQGLAAGLTESNAGTPPEQAQLEAKLRRAEPLLGDALAAFESASNALTSQQWLQTLTQDQLGINKLQTAREHFLDLRGLVELLYQDELRIEGLITSKETVSESDIIERLPAIIEAQQRNIDRLSPLTEHIMAGLQTALEATEKPTEEMAETAADPNAQAELKRLEQADQLRIQIDPKMRQAQKDLEAAQNSQPGAMALEVAEGLDSQYLLIARSSVHNTVEVLASLRELFFSVVDHLKKTLRKQVELGDETETTETLSATQTPTQRAQAMGPLTIAQQGLAETSASLADALRQQAEQTRQENSAQKEQPTQPDQAQQQAETLQQAAEYVAEAEKQMLVATKAIQAEGVELIQIREPQQQAVEALEKALATLQPSGDSSQQGDQPQDPGQQPPSQEEKPEELDRNKLLQGVRDREARRREQREQNQPQHYSPVLKDW